MVDLNAAIRKRLEEDRYAGTAGTVSSHADQYDAAICAVLDIHRPVECGNLRHEGGAGLHCALEECETAENPYGHYPCGTVLAIARALGVEGTQQAGTGTP